MVAGEPVPFGSQKARRWRCQLLAPEGCWVIYIPYRVNRVSRCHRVKSALIGQLSALIGQQNASDLHIQGSRTLKTGGGAPFRQNGAAAYAWNLQEGAAPSRHTTL